MRRLAIQLTSTATFDSRARLRAFNSDQQFKKSFLKVQVSCLDILSQTIQQKPNARINRARIQRNKHSSLAHESRAIRAPVE